uniref:hypothetical protein n=1 Tax=Nonomuraea pusilla TaxID=46177 RepID=UPI000AF32386|nr:hypothetical protein [Nonomuraea pusilla]
MRGRPGMPSPLPPTAPRTAAPEVPHPATSGEAARRGWARIPVAALALLVGVVSAVGGCAGAGSEAVAVRVNALPSGVRVPGPAVFLARVPGEERSGVLGLVRVGAFGDPLTEGAWVRKHAEVALGDPRIPTAVRGLADDPRDGVLAGGNVLDATLPDHVFLTRVRPAGEGLSWTSGRCVLVRRDGRAVSPAPEATCEEAANGGLYWTAGGGRPAYGGVDLVNGTASPAVELPASPSAVSPDGRYLAAVTRDRGLVIADARTGRLVRPSGSGFGSEGVFTSRGYVTVRDAAASSSSSGGGGEVSLVTPSGKVTDLLGPVGKVSFAPGGRRVVAVVTRPAARLVVADLDTGTATPVRGFPAPGPDLALALAGDFALAVPLPSALGDPRPVQVWRIDLGRARAERVATVPAATRARPVEEDRDRAGAPDPASGLTGLRFSPQGEVVALTAGGVTALGPAGARPLLPLPERRVLFAPDGGRGDTLLAVAESGARARVATGAAEDQSAAPVMPTSDGGHLIVALRPRSGAYPDPGPRDEVVLTRLDGTGSPLPLYRGAILAGVSPG